MQDVLEDLVKAIHITQGITENPKGVEPVKIDVLYIPSWDEFVKHPLKDKKGHLTWKPF